MRPAVLAFACVIACSAVDSRAAALSQQQIDDISRVAAETVQMQGLPALSVAVAKQGDIWTAALGKADVERDVAATPQSMFRTASVAKWFTGVAAMRLVESGALDLDAPIQRYCRQYPRKPWPISARMLLTHMSGIRHDRGSNYEASSTEAEKKALDALIAKERAAQAVRHTDVITPLAAFKDDPLLFQPATNTHYSSPGYRVLGCVLEGAARRPYRQLMRELVFLPAGMTSIVEDDVQATVPGRVTGYSKESGNLGRAAFRDVSENLPAGGYLSTAEDLVRFALAFKADALVKPATRQRMLEQPKLADGSPAPNPMRSPGYHYGLGVMVGPAGPQAAWFHTGSQAGTTALLFHFPEYDVAVGLMTNLDGSVIRESLARRIAEIAAK